MDTNEYLSYVTDSVIALESRIQKMENASIKIFAYSFNKFNDISYGFAECDKQFIEIGNNLTDIRKTIEELKSTIIDNQQIFDDTLTKNTLLQTECEKTLTLIKQYCEEHNVEIKEPSALSKFFKSIYNHIYNFVFYFKIKHKEKLRIVAEEKRRQEEIAKQEAEAAELKREQERLQQIKLQKEIKEKQEKEEQKRREDNIRKLQRIQDNNKIGNILSGIKKG